MLAKVVNWAFVVSLSVVTALNVWSLIQGDDFGRLDRILLSVTTLLVVLFIAWFFVWRKKE